MKINFACDAPFFLIVRDGDAGSGGSGGSGPGYGGLGGPMGNAAGMGGMGGSYSAGTDPGSGGPSQGQATSSSAAAAPSASSAPGAAPSGIGSAYSGQPSASAAPSASADPASSGGYFSAGGPVGNAAGMGGMGGFSAAYSPGASPAQGASAYGADGSFPSGMTGYYAGAGPNSTGTSWGSQVAPTSSNAPQGYTPADAYQQAAVSMMSVGISGLGDTGPGFGQRSDQAKSDALSNFYSTVIGAESKNQTYNSLNYEVPSTFNAPEDLTSMTFAEVKSLQKDMLAAQAGKPASRRSTAIGAFQMTANTLAMAQQLADIPDDALFNEENQQKAAYALAQNRANQSIDPTTGQIDVDAFANNLANEWAGFENSTGKSAYAGVGKNSANTAFSDVKSIAQSLVDTGAVTPSGRVSQPSGSVAQAVAQQEQARAANQTQVAYAAAMPSISPAEAASMEAAKSAPVSIAAATAPQGTQVARSSTQPAGIAGATQVAQAQPASTTSRFAQTYLGGPKGLQGLPDVTDIGPFASVNGPVFGMPAPAQRAATDETEPMPVPDYQVASTPVGTRQPFNPATEPVPEGVVTNDEIDALIAAENPPEDTPQTASQDVETADTAGQKGSKSGGRKAAATAINIGTSVIPGIGTAANIYNLAAMIFGGKTIGDMAVDLLGGDYPNSKGIAAASGDGTGDYSAMTFRQMPDGTWAVSPNESGASSDFAKRYLQNDAGRPTPAEKWYGEGSFRAA